MSGHSKWHSIKHKKGAADAKRGRIFTKLIKEITVAARVGGGDPDGNPRLRTAILAGKSENMPADNIKRAIQKGTGELPGAQYEEITYEGYGPGGVAIIVDAMSDNKNRTVSEMRHIFSKHGGNLGEANSVAWMFHKKGYLIVEKAKASEDRLMEVGLDAGIDDIREDGDNLEVLTAPESFESVLKAIKSAGIEPTTAEVSKVPQNYVKLDSKQAAQMLRLMEELEDHEDVQKVFANFDIEEKDLEAVVG
ncbi:MAG: YebC/PmpR family DNA-binding transcriptional regulator [Acidobacteriia bacterium]|nr:YebC/PmpR family DNA-binding transcriptional regulator [Terriglobia bacterium]